MCLACVQAHSWRVVGASTGATLQEYVVQQGEQVLRLDPLHQAPSSTSVSRSSSSSLGSEAGQDFLGFDGIGGLPEEYVQCEVRPCALALGAPWWGGQRPPALIVWPQRRRSSCCPPRAACGWGCCVAWQPWCTVCELECPHAVSPAWLPCTC